MGLLQRFGFKDSSYQRPTQNWVCGHASEGRGCNSGPNARGECGASYECYPNRVGDRWHCSRDALAGGKCRSGPYPDGRCARQTPHCLPVRSLRYRRARLTAWSLVLATGLLLAGLSGPWRLQLISAGDLSQGHGGVGMACIDCHSAAHESIWGWLNTALEPPAAVAESGRCTQCHHLGEAAMQPHGLSAAAFPAATASSFTRNMALDQAASLLGMELAEDADGNIACGNCHREHRGRQADLTVMNDQACQTCHEQRFSSFSDGHPEIDAYAFGRRTRLIFDHSAHEKSYLPMTRKALVCSDCHLTDQQGERMRVVGFEQGCGECHAVQIAGITQTGEKGLAIVGVPGLDLDYVSRQRIPIGEWPQDADADLPPVMSLLLSADERFEAAMEHLQGQDLLDLRLEDDLPASALQDYAWAIKSLIHDLKQGGQGVLQRRLSKVLKRPMSDAELASLSGMLSAGVLASAAEAWFPNLEQEIRLFRAGTPPHYPSDESADLRRTEAKGSAVGAAPIGDDEDILGTDIASDAAALAEAADDDILGEQTESDEADPLPAGKDTPLDDSSADILGGEAEDNGLEAEDILTSVELEDTESADILGQPDDAGEADALMAVQAVPDADARLERSAVDEWVKAGGWYRSHFRLYYRPTDHADRFLPAWLDMSSAAYSASEMAKVFGQMADPKAPGVCTKCHSVDALEQSMRVNWTGLRIDPRSKDFTRFSHTAHMSMTEQADCLRCHDWSEQVGGGYLQAYESADRLQAQGEFAPFRKAVCSECHGSGEAGDACLSCHNYHVLETERTSRR